MRTWFSPLLGIVLILAMMTAIPVTSQEGDGPEGTGDSSGQGRGRGGGNETSDNKTQGNANAQMGNQRDACREAAESGDDDFSDPDHPCYPYYRSANRGASDEVRQDYENEYGPEHQQSAEAQEHRMRQYNEQTGGRFGFYADETGYHGEHLSFIPYVGNQSFHGITYDGSVLIQAIEAPGPVERDTYLRGTKAEFRGDDWRVDFHDHGQRTMIGFRSDEASPFLLTLPPDATVSSLEPTPLLEITYATSGIVVRVNYSNGDFVPIGGDGANNTTTTQTFLSWGETRFSVWTAGQATPAGDVGSNQAIKDAWLNGKIGGEVDVRRGQSDGDVAALTTVYNDMELIFEAPPVAGQPGSTYTITVDSPAHEGKTIALNVESGILDPAALDFSYFNVHPNKTVPASIVQADDIHDVLDPLNDGVVAEWWIIEDINGVQVLISIPHFSIHKIELRTIGDIIVEQPSLVVGVLGAVLVVGIATRAMFRKPREE